MKKCFLVTVAFMATIIVASIASAVEVNLNLTIDPAKLGSSVVHLIIFNGPGILSVDAPGASTQIVNDWCIGPAVPQGDDLVVLYFPNQLGNYKCKIETSPFNKELKALIIGADTPRLGQNFTIVPNGQIRVTSLAPPGLLIHPAIVIASTNSAGKLATQWGKIKGGR